MVHRRSDRGSAAVEFALVSVILFPVLFGIIDYGLWFADSLSTRDGVRSAARTGSLGTFGTGCTDPNRSPRLDTPTTSGPVSGVLQSLACVTATQASPISGRLWVRIQLLNSSGAETTWASAVALRVCLVEKHVALLPLVPMPNGGVQVTKVQMMFEPGVLSGPSLPDAPSTGGGYDSGAPTDWGWCTGAASP